jgi:adenylate cyclase
VCSAARTDPVRRGGPERDAGFDLLAQVREAAIQERFTKLMVPIVDLHLAQERTRLGDLDSASAIAGLTIQ